MASDNLRAVVLGYLDSIPDHSPARPTEVARAVGVGAKDLNPVLLKAQQDGEVILTADGSVRLADHLWGQLPPQPPGPPIPLVAWGAGAGWEKGLVLLCSILIIFVILYAALGEGDIPDRRYNLLRTILALAGAGYTIGIPGFIVADIAIKKFLAVRAAGALAVFVVIYFVPAGM